MILCDLFLHSTLNWGFYKVVIRRLYGVLYSTVHSLVTDSEAYEECTTAIIAAASLPTILAQSRAKNIVCAHHEIVRTKVI